MLANERLAAAGMNRTIRYSYLTKFATTAKESRAFDTMHCKYDLYGDIPKEPVENFETEGGAPHRSNAAPLLASGENSHLKSN